MVAVITACQPQPQLAYAPAGPANQPSRRTSSCGYTVGFGEQRAVISGAAHDLLTQAAAEARRRGTAKLTVSATVGPAETGSLQDQRTSAVAEELTRLGFAANEIDVGHIYDRPPTRPGARVFVCDLADDKALQAMLPADPEQTVTYTVGAAELRIPLRYLAPAVWRDVPFEPRNTGSVGLDLGWPGLQDRMSAVMRHCTRTGLSGCIGRVGVEVIPAGSRPRQVVGESGLVAIRGQLHDGAWFAYGNWQRWAEAVLQVRDADGSPFVVSCRWPSFDVPVPDAWQPTLDGVRTLTGGPRSYCKMVVSISRGLDADVTFGGNDIADWRAIRSAVRELILRWQAPASGGPPPSVKPS